MKNYARIVLLVVPILFAACAGSSKYMIKASSMPMEQPPPGKGVVYFMRPSGFGFAINFQVWDETNFIGLSQAKSYFAYECDPGKHLFIGIAENKRGVEVDVEAGKSYYVITQVRMGGWRARMAFVPVTRNSEFWGQVETYEKQLNFIVPKKEEVSKWEAKKKAEVQEIIRFLETEEGKAYIVYLNSQDGR